MAPAERSMVRQIALDAWRDIRRRPLMWLLLSASSVPLIFLFYFLAPGSPAQLYFILLFAGYAICFSLSFLFWCMAVFLYDDEVRGKGKLSYRGAYARMGRWSWPSFLAGLVCGLVTVFAFMIAQILVGWILSTVAAGTSGGGSQIALSLVYFYLSYLAADLVVVFIVLVPQMLALEGGRRVEEVLRASYALVKERYRDALLLFIIPELVARTIFLGASFVLIYLPGLGLVFTVLMMVMALLEGARICFVAAAFNRFYYQVLEEEKKKKRKAKGKAKAKQKSKKKR